MTLNSNNNSLHSHLKLTLLFSISHTHTWQCLTNRAATMKLRTSDPSIIELQNWRSHTLSRPLTWTTYRVVTWIKTHTYSSTVNSLGRSCVMLMSDSSGMCRAFTTCGLKKTVYSLKIYSNFSHYLLDISQYPARHLTAVREHCV